MRDGLVSIGQFSQCLAEFDPGVGLEPVAAFKHGHGGALSAEHLMKGTYVMLSLSDQHECFSLA